MKRIYLVRKKFVDGAAQRFTLVDDRDYKMLNKLKWHYAGGYAKASVAGRPVQMANAIMRPAKGYVVDHINNNGLDNRRANLEIVSRRENARRAHAINGNWRARWKVGYVPRSKVVNEKDVNKPVTNI